MLLRHTGIFIKLNENKANVAMRNAKKYTFVTKSMNVRKVGMLKRAGI